MTFNQVLWISCFPQSWQLCSVIPQPSSQWGNGATHFQCKYPRGFFKHNWDNWQFWFSRKYFTFTERGKLILSLKFATDPFDYINTIVLNQHFYLVYISHVKHCLQYCYKYIIVRRFMFFLSSRWVILTKTSQPQKGLGEQSPTPP